MSTQFENWWEAEGKQIRNIREACRTAWENGAFCALNIDPDDYLNEPLGQACQIGDETCESCQ